MTTSAFDAVIFDLDGVLLDSEPIYLGATNAVLAREGKYVSPEENARFIGFRYRDMLADIIPRLDLAHPAEYYIRETGDIIRARFNGPLDPPPGAVDLLDRLDRAGIPRAVGSSSHHAWVEKILGHLGLRERFPIVVGGDDVAHGKPAPDIFLRCAELLGVPPGRCVVIEDSANGVLAARRAGMAAIGLRSAATATLTLEGCLAVVDGFPEAHTHLGLPEEDGGGPL